MELDFTTVRFTRSWSSGDSAGCISWAPEKILLRGPEACKECGRVFESLYIIRLCMDHESLERL